ncbi:MAG: hypothetical protein RLZZ501_1009 [Pseudomonadota bacterium]|jgi:PAS domain S-box-containing protein
MSRRARRVRTGGLAVLLVLAMVAPLAPAGAGSATAIDVSPGLARPITPERVRVMIDDTYPPYSFRAADGALQGILPDLWALWSQRSGIPVELIGLDWAEAQRRFNAGEGEVLDTVFHTAERDRIYLFSAPYATIEVPIVFEAGLSGIHDATALRGFTVGVKGGDACIDFLRRQGIDSLHPYPSYESLIDGAARGEIRVACIDRPPASYYLVQKGLESRFRASPPLYAGEFHWVVRKGDDGLRETVQAAFDRISPEQRRRIVEHWLGEPLRSNLDPQTVRAVGLALLGIGLIGVLLLVWVGTLRRQVAAKTRDLTSALAELSAGALRFRTLFDVINDAILLHDAETGAIRLTNRRTRDLFGLRGGETAGTLTLADLCGDTPPYDAATALDHLHATADGPRRLEWLARHHDGHPLWVEVDLRRVVLDDSGPQVLAVLRDITARKESDEQLARTLDALTRSNTDLERFAYAASHDLREPLNTLVRYAQLLERRLEGSDPGIAEPLGVIATAARQMMRLVEGLLEFSRVDAAGRGFDPVDAGRALTVALGYLDQALTEAGATVEAAPLPQVAADETQLIQLFQNLIGNAVKYRDRARPLRVRVSARRDGAMWEFTVADNGIGIEADYLEQIFVIFKRLHAHSAIPGVGIGLALCRRIVERHGGRLWVESTPGQGSAFRFILGAVPEAE